MSIKVLILIVFLSLTTALTSCGNKPSPQPGPFPELPSELDEQKPNQSADIEANQGREFDNTQTPFIPCCVGEIRVGTFNLESGNADINYLLSDMGKFGAGVDIWGFQEVEPIWFAPIIDGLQGLNNEQFRGVISRSGGENRLMIAYNAKRLRLESYEELDWINVNRRVRAPLVARFTVIETGLEFVFVNNHLYRGSDSGRHQQARLLNEWGQLQEYPTIAVGDYNFDWDLGGLERDFGYDLLTENEIFIWVKPRDLIKTQCNWRYNSILDFIFLAGKAQSWQASSKIKFEEPEYCIRNPWRSDHRPVTAVLLPTAS